MPTARQRLHERVRLRDGVTILTFWQRTISLFSWRSLSFPVQTYGCYSWVTRQLCACLVRVFFSQKGLGLLKFLYEKQNSHFHVILKMCLFYCIVGVHFIYSDPYFERQLGGGFGWLSNLGFKSSSVVFAPVVERWTSSLPSHARWDSLGICHSSQTCVLTSRVFFKWGCCRTTGFPASDSCFRIPSINLSIFSNLVLGFHRQDLKAQPMPGVCLARELQDYVSAFCSRCGSAGLVARGPSARTGKVRSWVWSSWDEDQNLKIWGHGSLPQAREYKYLVTWVMSDGWREQEI